MQQINESRNAPCAPTQAMVAYGAFGKETELLVQDSAAMAAEGERVSFAQLQARASAVGQVLIGFFDLPKSVEQPLQLVINPEACALRLLTPALHAGRVPSRKHAMQHPCSW